MGVGNERISFRVLPATKAICIYHKGAYDRLGEDIYRYDLENGYRGRDCTGNATSTAFGTRKT
ncbi:MAG: hypothetical protein J6K03_02610 [Oscillospiraceae bacterium]|nr:hypothetical protein [Oscillospiraceae bacterium]